MSYLGNREPSLDEMLEDPIVRLVMARDRLRPDDVRAYVEAAVRRLGRETWPAYLLVRSD
jgi:hypothetical protein